MVPWRRGRSIVAKRGWGILLGLAGILASAQEPPTHRVRLVLMPLGAFPEHLMASLERELPKTLPVTLARVPGIPVPESTRSKFRPSRFRADGLLGFLKGRSEGKGGHILGLTQVDISCTKAPFDDWGIFGYGFCPGPSAVVSTFRLKRNVDKARLEHRTLATAVHEVGHMLGLDHCEEPNCIMQDAKGSIANTDSSTGFGPGCRTRLRMRCTAEAGRQAQGGSLVCLIRPFT